MLDRAWGGSFRWRRDGRPQESPKPSRLARKPQVEDLEGRQLLAAAIAAISPVSVAAGQGIQVPLDGSASGATSQTFAVTSTNPEIKATIAKGDFITLNVTHAASGKPNDPSFSGAITYQDFQDLTPNTAAAFESFTNAGDYNGTTFFRVVPSFSGGTPPGDAVIQGGPQPGSGTRPLELNQQLAFNSPGTVAVANAGANTDGQEFFITNGPQTELNYGYTIYGQVVAGQNVADEIGSVAVQALTSGGEVSSPVSPVDITTSTVSTLNPNGVIHIDATGATAGQTATITVTATDPADGTTATQTFVVTTTTAATIPATATFKPTTGSPAPSSLTTTEGSPVAFTAPFTSNTPATSTGTTTANKIVTAPAHGTVSFNGQSATYTPTAGYTGTDTFSYAAVNTNSTSGADPASVTGNTVTVNVNVTGIPLGTPITGTPSPSTLSSVLGAPVTFSAPYTPNLPSGSTTITTANTIVTAPSHGTVTFNGQTGTYTPTAGYTGSDSFSYAAVNTNSAPGANPKTVQGNTVTVSVTDNSTTNTGAVRVIGTVLVVTPPPTTLKATNTVYISQMTDSLTSPASQVLAVSLNGQIDSTTPTTSSITQIVVYGAKANNNIAIASSVPSSIDVEISGGHNGKNFVQAGSGTTLEQGWFGKTTLIGGTGSNQMIGAKGHVTFKPTSTTGEIAAISPHPGIYNYRAYHNRVSYSIQPPTGTFYKYVKGHLVPIATPKATKKKS